MAEPATPPTLDARWPRRLAEFARACKAARARGVALPRRASRDRRRRSAGSRRLTAALTDERPLHARRSGRSTLLLDDACAGQARSRDRRARRRPAPAPDRRADAQRRRRRRLVAHAAAAAGAPAGRSPRRRRDRAACGPRPAGRAWRSWRSTTPRSCARSRGRGRRPIDQILAAALERPAAAARRLGDARAASISSAIPRGSTS